MKVIFTLIYVYELCTCEAQTAVHQPDLILPLEYDAWHPLFLCRFHILSQCHQPVLGKRYRKGRDHWTVSGFQPQKRTKCESIAEFIQPRSQGIFWKEKREDPRNESMFHAQSHQGPVLNIFFRLSLLILSTLFRTNPDKFSIVVVTSSQLYLNVDYKAILIKIRHAILKIFEQLYKIFEQLLSNFLAYSIYIATFQLFRSRIWKGLARPAT